MQVRISSFLKGIKPKLLELIVLLEKEFDYASVLATDVSGINYQVGLRETKVSDYDFNERGLVVRVYWKGTYLEYSFNEIEDVKELAEKITKELKAQFEALDVLGIEKLESPFLVEDEIVKEMNGEIGIDPSEVSAEEILKCLKGFCEEGAKKDGVIEFRIDMNFVKNNKMYLSSKKDLVQSYAFADGMMFAVGNREEKTQMAFELFSGLKGAEILEELNGSVETVLARLEEKLNASTVVPGMYDVIVAPEVAGLIAHEAFGHGVEMDMFVKDRALAKDYIGKTVASPITNMKDGALSAVEVGSYLFDDEGVLGTDTTIISEGTLKTGISDLLSALRLGTEPTGNGRRESFERKAYARMTNTIFVPGDAKLEDMIASIEDGYLLEGMEGGMEDPKHWGIQCMAAMGREIKNGKLTGKIVTPITITGYVPDMLKSISMVSGDFHVLGGGACGKGHKEWVKVSDGGPYLKCKVRLG